MNTIDQSQKQPAYSRGLTVLYSYIFSDEMYLSNNVRLKVRVIKRELGMRQRQDYSFQMMLQSKSVDWNLRLNGYGLVYRRHELTEYQDTRYQKRIIRDYIDTLVFIIFLLSTTMILIFQTLPS